MMKALFKVEDFDSMQQTVTQFQPDQSIIWKPDMLAPFLKLSTDNPLPPSIKAESLCNELLSIYRGMPSNEI